MRFKWYDFIFCAVGKHFVAGWGKTVDGVYTSHHWCLRCKVVMHDERHEW